jgi:hypothetical protein
MPVPFSEVQFRNQNGIAVDVIVEAPIGVPAAGPTSVGPMSMSIIPLGGVVNCPSCRITAADPSHTTSQTFAVAPPVNGVPVFLSRLAVSYVIGAFTGTMVAITEGTEVDNPRPNEG